MRLDHLDSIFFHVWLKYPEIERAKPGRFMVVYNSHYIMQVNTYQAAREFLQEVSVPGDAKPVSLIEDTAIRPDLLPQYIRDFKKIMEQYNLNCVYHAHVATGELHLRPVLNLKDPAQVVLFRKVATEVALLVKVRQGLRTEPDPILLELALQQAWSLT